MPISLGGIFRSCYPARSKTLDSPSMSCFKTVMSKDTAFRTDSGDGIDWRYGGQTYGRPLKTLDPFEHAVETALGDRVRADERFAELLWGALSNVEWSHDGQRINYSWRAAGDLVAALRREGNYLDWYCSGCAGIVPTEIAEAMAKLGWTYSGAIDTLDFETVEEAHAAGIFSGTLKNGDTFGDEDDGPEGGFSIFTDLPYKPESKLS